MAKPSGPRPEIGEFPIDTGTCELEPDPYNANGWVLRINGVPSSHIDLADPLQLDFEYMRWIASLVDARWAGTDRLRVLHLGGGACSLARRFAASHPQARQVVVELDGRLAELVRQWFDLPRAPLVRIRVGEARAVTESLSEASRDLVIRDVFAGAVTPQPLTTREFTRAAKRVLAPDGVYVVNCGDGPNLAMAKREAATIGAEFTHTVILADPAMLKGRRYGNVIVAGSDAPLGDAPGLARELLGGGVPAHLWQDARVRSFAAGAQALTD
ncbi:spermidine synthase [Arthrobacter agilis]|uniref:spermidine synthase n=1 Tax=Arthrobacter agilis TaxID=37921 RepID=UPI000B35DFD4|nr:fused MFS/spermidine synthase [Arthrobacter agilis]OUM43596.1 spermidine synthase [Arthrobacter agilis]PPB46817.1 spermidine synthase [Arthrobacter agilis]TPV24843.1 spermidine synthase [Arthrobacter agilis]VDR30994.1 spermidine synthase [Arthrobacter agilis]